MNNHREPDYPTHEMFLNRWSPEPSRMDASQRGTPYHIGGWNFGQRRRTTHSLGAFFMPCVTPLYGALPGSPCAVVRDTWLHRRIALCDRDLPSASRMVGWCFRADCFYPFIVAANYQLWKRKSTSRRATKEASDPYANSEELCTRSLAFSWQPTALLPRSLFLVEMNDDFTDAFSGLRCLVSRDNLIEWEPRSDG